MNNMEIGAVVSYLGGGIGFFAIFTYLFFKEKQSYLKYWTSSWGLTILSLIIFIINLSMMSFFLLIVYDFSVVLSGFSLQKGTSLYLDSRKKRIWLLLILLVTSIVIVFSAVIGNMSLLLTIPFMYLSMSYIITGILLWYNSKEFFPKTIGIISLLFGVFSYIGPYLYQYTWLVNYTTPIMASLGSTFGLGLIGLHYNKMYSKLEKRESVIKKLSFHDQLTGLYNRRYFEKKIENLNEAKKAPVTIIVADMDGLKHINDNYGHQMGDRFIKKAAEILKSCVRSDDIIARIGGDEFSLILPGVNPDIAKRLCKDIKAEIKIFNKKRELPEAIEIPLGYATKTSEKEDLNNIFNQADLRMYENKGKRRRELS